MKNNRASVFIVFITAMCMLGNIVVDAQAEETTPTSEPSPSPSVTAAEPANGAKLSGLVEITGYKYPVYLYVPQDYQLDRIYPMIIMAPSETTTDKEQMEYLKGLGQRWGIFILAPHALWPQAGTVPYNLDEWLLSVKKDVMERFPINKKRVYLFGKDSGAHYAAYLAMQKPTEFSAVALLGKAWDGSFEQLIKVHTSKENQVPFYVALKAGSDDRLHNQSWLDQLQAKGYLIYLTEYQKDEDLNSIEFKKAVFDWLEDKSQSWAAIVGESQKGWKGKFKKGLKDFFTV